MLLNNYIDWIWMFCSSLCGGGDDENVDDDEWC